MYSPPTNPRRGYHYRFETLKGYLLQSEDSTDDSEFDFLKQNFGLIERGYEGEENGENELGQWKRFERFVRGMSEGLKKGEKIKVLFLGRHGQGWHNVAETKYGTTAWDCYWSLLDGADGITWSDANLTEVGHGQAKDVHELWKSSIENGIPLPETYYVSPLTRTIETADVSFQALELPEDKQYRPVIKELLREAISIHTCDRRSTASHILKTFPHVSLEAGFEDEDPFWSADLREPRSARKYRLAQLLDDIFENDDGLVLSLTSHSGAIGSILEAIEHRPFALQTGGVIPVFVKAVRVDGDREVVKVPWEGPPECKEPPLGLPN